MPFLQPWLKRHFLATGAVALIWLIDGRIARAGIHTAPIVLRGSQIKAAARLPISQYRLFRTENYGKAVAIPFQIDEVDEFGDYVLGEGKQNNGKASNGIFDLQDELAFMGDDVGPLREPTSWDGKRPPLLFEIRLALPAGNPAGPSEGAVYLAAYADTPPPVAPQRYVSFSEKLGEVMTSRYRYLFDQKNYLVLRGVDMFPPLPNGSQHVLPSVPGSPTLPKTSIPLLNSSTMYLKADLKYFLTMEANQNTIESSLDAFKVGPIRAVVRVSFFYRFLRLNFELGMYTEVSFFANSVNLPAVLFNPLDGYKSLNSGSGFFYGFAMNDNPNIYHIESNMPAYAPRGILDFFKKNRTEPVYWIAATTPDRLMYVEINPSKQMQTAGAVPMLYLDNTPEADLKNRGVQAPLGLGEAPVNMALFFDLTKFKEGEHLVAFRLFFENKNQKNLLQSFRDLGNWQIFARPIW